MSAPAAACDRACRVVCGVRVQRDVGNYGNVGVGILDGPDRSLNETVRIGALGAIEALFVGIDDRKQGNGGNAQVDSVP